jgi:thioredoxin-related protein
MRKTVLTICVVGLAAVTLLGGCKRSTNNPDSGGPDSADAGQTAIEFLKENKLLGKPVLIEFGMVGCELSNEGLETMIQQHDFDAIEGLQFVRVEASDDTKAVAEYYKEKTVKFLVVQDPARKLADAFGATIYPLFLLIDKFGNTRYMSVFPEEIAEWTEMLMAETDDPGPNMPRLGVKELDGQELLTSTKLPELGGSTQALSEYAGPGGVMLVFADTSCPYSNQAVTELSGVSLTLSKAAQINTVVVNISDPEKSVREYYAKKKLDLPVVYDVGTATRIGWDVHSVPTIILFDAQGRIAYNGPAVWSDVGQAGEMALGLPPGALKFQAKGTKFG